MSPEPREAGSLSVDGVMRQLERILASRIFANSPRSRQFLRFGVEAALAGRHAISEYSIGVDVFERNPRFDPRLDPIVRVHARRLRLKLAQYYEAYGADDLITIELPLRSYIPVFRAREPKETQLTKRRGAPLSLDAKMSIVVFPFVTLASDQSDRSFGDGVTREVIYALVNMKLWRVISWSAEAPSTDLSNVVGNSNVDAGFFGTLRKTETGYRISAELVSLPDRTILWSQMFQVDLDGVITTQLKIAHVICQALAQEADCCRS